MMLESAERSRAHARIELRRLLETLEASGTSVVDRVCGHGAPEPWLIYPGEYGIYDRAGRSQFYFHRHETTDHELGHFHTVRLFRDRVASRSAPTAGRPRCSR
jgi:hypothetical protein